jgi:hypothetical protein
MIAINTVGESGHDWSKSPLVRIDPYVVWADITRRAGLHRGATSDEPCAASLELTQSANRLSSEQLGVWNVAPAHQKSNSRFCTAFLPWGQLVRLASEVATERHALIRRIELGEALAVPSPVVPILDHGADDRLDGNVVAFIDYGCPFAHEKFRVPNDPYRTRVRFIWDQGRKPARPWTTPAAPNESLFWYGGELKGDCLDRLLRAHSAQQSQPVNESACYEELQYSLMRGQATHGAHVMDVAAGWPDPLTAQAAGSRDLAGSASIVFVQLPWWTVADSSGASMNVYVVDALRYIQSRTGPDAHVVVNLSYGYFAGPHDGSSLLERAMDAFIAERQHFDIVIPAGNSFNRNCHVSFRLGPRDSRTWEWHVAADDPTDSFVEIWYSGEAELSVAVKSPSESSFVQSISQGEVGAWSDARDADPACVVAHVRAATESPMGDENHCALIALAPTKSVAGRYARAQYGSWQVTVQRTDSGPTDPKTNEVEIHAWIERDDPILEVARSQRQSRFGAKQQTKEANEYPESEALRKAGTLNGIATGKRTIVAGAYIAATGQLAPYTAAGPGRNGARPAGEIWLEPADDSVFLPGRRAAGNRSGVHVRMSGTSVAAPQVTRWLLNNSHQ